MTTEKMSVVDPGHDFTIHIARNVVLADREQKGPPVSLCRHAVLQVVTGYVVYDRFLSRIVDGVYQDASDALGAAQWFNESPDSAEASKPPNGDALRLFYPAQ